MLLRACPLAAGSHDVERIISSATPRDASSSKCHVIVGGRRERQDRVQGGKISWGGVKSLELVERGAFRSQCGAVKTRRNRWQG